MRPTKRSQRDLQELEEDLVPKQARIDEGGERFRVHTARCGVVASSDVEVRFNSNYPAGYPTELLLRMETLECAHLASI